MPYLANTHIIGCLPDGVETFDTLEDAWEHLTSLLGEGAWEADNEDDVSGPHSLTRHALQMQSMAEREEEGTVYSEDGMKVFEVEWLACSCRDLGCPDH